MQADLRRAGMQPQSRAPCACLSTPGDDGGGDEAARRVRAQPGSEAHPGGDGAVTPAAGAAQAAAGRGLPGWLKRLEESALFMSVQAVAACEIQHPAVCWLQLTAALLLAGPAAVGQHAGLHAAPADCGGERAVGLVGRHARVCCCRPPSLSRHTEAPSGQLECKTFLPLPDPAAPLLRLHLAQRRPWSGCKPPRPSSTATWTSTRCSARSEAAGGTRGSRRQQQCCIFL